MQYDVIMNLDFYVFQNILDSYTRILKARKEEEENEEKNNGYNEKDFSPENAMRQVQKQMPKIPKGQIPKF